MSYAQLYATSVNLWINYANQGISFHTTSRFLEKSSDNGQGSDATA